MVEGKAEHVGPFVDLFGRGFTGTVPGLGIDTNEHGVIACIFFLQGGGEFERVGGHHAVVVVGGSNKGSWVVCALFYVVKRTVFIEVFVGVGIIGTALFNGPAPTHGEFVVTKHIEHAYAREGHLKEVGALGHAGPYKESAVATSMNS